MADEEKREWKVAPPAGIMQWGVHVFLPDSPVDIVASVIDAGNVAGREQIAEAAIGSAERAEGVAW
jgi:broad specificity polyphosphatase/5'/3'-nucleotidase SurE